MERLISCRAFATGLILIIAPFLFGGNPESFDEIKSPILLIADVANGKIVFGSNINEPQPPASLAKIMTLHLSLKAVEEGRLSLSELYPIPEGGRSEDMRPGSSVLGLREGDLATLQTLQRAAGIASANDAAWSLALLSSGDIDTFLGWMNIEAEKLGMASTWYTDPDGWSSISRTTAADQAILAIEYITSHPNVLEDIHSLNFMEYSVSDQLAYRPEKKNTNLLLQTYPGADGLKTGTLPGTNFQFISTARREDTRFLAIVMGLESEDYFSGMRQRALDASILLDWAFETYVTWRATELPEKEILLRHGVENTIRVSTASLPEPQTLEIENGDVRVVFDLPDVLTAPLEKGDVVGSIRWVNDSGVVAESSMVVTEERGRRWRLRDFLNLKRK